MLKYKHLIFDFSYFIVLLVSVGGVLTLGAIVAPVVFHPEIVGLDMSRFESGLLMSEIFRRFSYFLNFTALFIVLYEIIKYRFMQRDKIVILSAITSFATISMFTSVYIPKILELQAKGKEFTSSKTFDNLHFASELDFKILAVALLVLFVRRLMLLKRG